MNTLELNRMGKSWFVSKKYNEVIDSSHVNWKHTRTVNTRESAYKRSRVDHIDFLKEVIASDPKMLGINTLYLTGNDVINMAKKILDVIE